MSRTTKSIKNIVVAIFCQIMIIIIGFVARKIFILFLSIEYLGLNDLFTSILTVLSLTDLGLGHAMIFSLYKPLADKDIPVCRALMSVYRKAYLIIGFVVLILGCGITPFITQLIKEIPPNVSGIHIIYVMFVINTSISYFFSYKRSLITASQNQYQINVVHIIIYFIMNSVQVLILVLTHNYYFFLCVQIIATFTENLVLSKKVMIMYPWLRENGEIIKIPQDILNTIVRNVKAMIFHRIGGIISDATDNLLISKFFGLLFLGIYSNYLLILNAIKGITQAFFSSITASIGDFGVQKSAEESFELYKKIQFFNYWLISFCSISLMMLINPFIEVVWLGKGYLISNSILIIVILNFYINNMRCTILTFKEAFGLPWYDRFKPLIGAIVNLFSSILLAKKWGVIGIFLGTTITQLSVNVWVEAYVVFKYGFHKSLFVFLKEYLLYNMIFLMNILITYAGCSLFSSFSISNFLIRCTFCLIIPNGIIYMIYHKTLEFQYILKLIMQYVPLYKRK